MSQPKTTAMQSTEREWLTDDYLRCWVCHETIPPNTVVYRLLTPHAKKVRHTTCSRPVVKEKK